jgi:hypothetical protein
MRPAHLWVRLVSRCSIAAKANCAHPAAFVMMDSAVPWAKNARMPPIAVEAQRALAVNAPAATFALRAAATATSLRIAAIPVFVTLRPIPAIKIQNFWGTE